MIVDDDSDIRMALQIALSSRGYDVVDAATGDEALEKLRPDINVVVLDVGLPGAGGLHTCRLIRAKSRARIIMMSAQRSHGEAEALSAGAGEYMVKPFSVEELIARINR
jgi:two-component system KDP operon response regulator KdpE